ncbi:uncharacterized protein MONOS_1800 [Monocercomonoides exilis]|uniref:uncharacterized protein n=1 Tax=Monocercomonoides exilis TaxID=2049356 RepID=UPI00355ABDFE|nr:hypothetical protein MONOS_1800 [Monocercomonoides exilis]|eukprot:MONOS_1800.1-p1 / transcript=MONOS_1800.1 / gene=MONOS_1800 / organism=Monocercomonoides_exilis_PA203 / gene_product=unspecified product / transcript_product=unspecified product / location=Mono_scaffold00034:3549-10208(+) / protein_length=2220 / sequence_SO=supercontig / SO=protein_coding / is_pseudo=false
MRKRDNVHADAQKLIAATFSITHASNSTLQSVEIDFGSQQGSDSILSTSSSSAALMKCSCGADLFYHPTSSKIDFLSYSQTNRKQQVFMNMFHQKITPFLHKKDRGMTSKRKGSLLSLVPHFDVDKTNAREIEQSKELVKKASDDRNPSFAECTLQSSNCSDSSARLLLPSFNIHSHFIDNSDLFVFHSKLLRRRKSVRNRAFHPCLICSAHGRFLSPPSKQSSEQSVFPPHSSQDLFRRETYKTIYREKSVQRRNHYRNKRRHSLSKSEIPFDKRRFLFASRLFKFDTNSDFDEMIEKTNKVQPCVKNDILMPFSDRKCINKDIANSNSSHVKFVSSIERPSANRKNKPDLDQQKTNADRNCENESIISGEAKEKPSAEKVDLSEQSETEFSEDVLFHSPKQNHSLSGVNKRIQSFARSLAEERERTIKKTASIISSLPSDPSECFNEICLPQSLYSAPSFSSSQATTLLSSSPVMPVFLPHTSSFPSPSLTSPSITNQPNCQTSARSSTSSSSSSPSPSLLCYPTSLSPKSGKLLLSHQTLQQSTICTQSNEGTACPLPESLILCLPTIQHLLSSTPQILPDISSAAQFSPVSTPLFDSFPKTPIIIHSPNLELFGHSQTAFASRCSSAALPSVASSSPSLNQTITGNPLWHSPLLFAQPQPRRAASSSTSLSPSSSHLELHPFHPLFSDSSESYTTRFKLNTSPTMQLESSGQSLHFVASFPECSPNQMVSLNTSARIEADSTKGSRFSNGTEPLSKNYSSIGASSIPVQNSLMPFQSVPDGIFRLTAAKQQATAFASPPSLSMISSFNSPSLPSFSGFPSSEIQSLSPSPMMIDIASSIAAASCDPLPSEPSAENPFCLSGAVLRGTYSPTFVKQTPSTALQESHSLPPFSYLSNARITSLEPKEDQTLSSKQISSNVFSFPCKSLEQQTMISSSQSASIFHDSPSIQMSQSLSPQTWAGSTHSQNQSIRLFTPPLVTNTPQPIFAPSSGTALVDALSTSASSAFHMFESQTPLPETWSTVSDSMNECSNCSSSGTTPTDQHLSPTFSSLRLPNFSYTADRQNTQRKSSVSKFDLSQKLIRLFFSQTYAFNEWKEAVNIFNQYEEDSALQPIQTSPVQHFALLSSSASSTRPSLQTYLASISAANRLFFSFNEAFNVDDTGTVVDGYKLRSAVDGSRKEKERSAERTISHLINSINRYVTPSITTPKRAKDLKRSFSINPIQAIQPLNAPSKDALDSICSTSFIASDAAIASAIEDSISPPLFTESTTSDNSIKFSSDLPTTNATFADEKPSMTEAVAFLLFTHILRLAQESDIHEVFARSSLSQLLRQTLSLQLIINASVSLLSSELERKEQPFALIGESCTTNTKSAFAEESSFSSSSMMSDDSDKAYEIDSSKTEGSNVQTLCGVSEIEDEKSISSLNYSSNCNDFFSQENIERTNSLCCSNKNGSNNFDMKKDSNDTGGIKSNSLTGKCVQHFDSIETQSEINLSLLFPSSLSVSEDRCSVLSHFNQNSVLSSSTTSFEAGQEKGKNSPIELSGNEVPSDNHPSSLLNITKSGSSVSLPSFPSSPSLGQIKCLKGMHPLVNSYFDASAQRYVSSISLFPLIVRSSHPLGFFISHEKHQHLDASESSLESLQLPRHSGCSESQKVTQKLLKFSFFSEISLSATSCPMYLSPAIPENFYSILKNFILNSLTKAPLSAPLVFNTALFESFNSSFSSSITRSPHFGVLSSISQPLMNKSTSGKLSSFQNSNRNEKNLETNTAVMFNSSSASKPSCFISSTNHSQSLKSRCVESNDHEKVTSPLLFTQSQMFSTAECKATHKESTVFSESLAFDHISHSAISFSSAKTFAFFGCSQCASIQLESIEAAIYSLDVAYNTKIAPLHQHEFCVAAVDVVIEDENGLSSSNEDDKWMRVLFEKRRHFHKIDPNEQMIQKKNKDTAISMSGRIITNSTNTGKFCFNQMDPLINSFRPCLIHICDCIDNNGIKERHQTKRIARIISLSSVYPPIMDSSHNFLYNFAISSSTTTKKPLIVHTLLSSLSLTPSSNCLLMRAFHSNRLLPVFPDYSHIADIEANNLVLSSSSSIQSTDHAEVISSLPFQHCTFPVRIPIHCKCYSAAIANNTFSVLVNNTSFAMLLKHLLFSSSASSKQNNSHCFEKNKSRNDKQAKFVEITNWFEKAEQFSISSDECRVEKAHSLIGEFIFDSIPFVLAKPLKE